jgi:hypothetical protein
MAAFTLENAFDIYTGVDTPVPATRFVQDRQERLFAADVEQLAGLRFSIVITAKWEASRDQDPERRKELRGELENLRYRYFEKIDHIAMSFGVARAMIAKDDVERRITVPLRNKLPDFPANDGQLSY